MFRTDRLITWISSSLVLYRVLTVVISFRRRDRNRKDSYRVSTVDVPQSPIASGARGLWHQKRCDSLHCHKEWWGSIPPIVVFSPERWKKGVLQERALVGSVYHLLCRYSTVLYYPINVIRHNEYHLLRTLRRNHFLWTRIPGRLPFIWVMFQICFLWVSPGFVHSDDSSKKVVAFPLVTVPQGLCKCIAVPLLQLWSFMG